MKIAKLLKKSAVFVVKKPLEMVPNFQMFEKVVKSVVF